VTLLEEAYALTTAYIKVYPSSIKTLHENTLKCPVEGVGDSDREMAQVPKDKHFLRSTAYIESLSSVVDLMTAMLRPWVGQGNSREGREEIGVSSGRSAIVVDCIRSRYLFDH
jgi:hypothetical protein